MDRGALADYSSWGCKEQNKTEGLPLSLYLFIYFYFFESKRVLLYLFTIIIFNFTIFY